MFASFDQIPFSMIRMNRIENQKQQHDSQNTYLKPDRLFPGSHNIKSRFLAPLGNIDFQPRITQQFM